MPLEPIVIDFLLSTSIGEVHIVALMAPHSYDNQAASQMRNILQQPEYHRISPVNPDPFLGTWPADQSVPHLNTSRSVSCDIDSPNTQYSKTDVIFKVG